MSFKKNKILKRVLWTILIIFIWMNIVAFMHAYKFTHYSNDDIVKTEANKLTTGDKIKIIFSGINNPRPKNNAVPTQPFNKIILESNKRIECWQINTANAKGTVILFHGYTGQKSSMLDKSDEFIKQGYSCLLVDFMGSGGSEGNQTTIGFKEAAEIKSCFDYLKNKGEQRIYLFGTSMGAVAILKAIKDYKLNPAGIIIECPFGSMYKMVCARFKMVHAPVFPMAGLLVFWGGIQNGFWAFGHNPTEYAKSVTCPTLLLYGEKDDRVSRQEIDEIYSNLAGKKYLKTYPLAGHENYLLKYKQQWLSDVITFMNSIPN
ncbi:MAG: alpha/beta hydrolase [Ferruginibacter sp.]